MSIRIILTDDHTILRHGLYRLFEQEQNIEMLLARQQMATLL
jgi:DNA-binding NarL/FixJ family response regulator